MVVVARASCDAIPQSFGSNISRSNSNQRPNNSLELGTQRGEGERQDVLRTCQPVLLRLQPAIWNWSRHSRERGLDSSTAGTHDRSALLPRRFLVHR